jgi:hypothetical protein
MNSSNSISVAEENPLDIHIDLTDPLSLSNFLQKQLSQPPNPWINIVGTHTVTSKETSSVEKITDFDLKTYGLNPKLVRLELTSVHDGREVHSISESDQTSEGVVEGMIERCCERVLDIQHAGFHPKYI